MRKAALCFRNAKSAYNQMTGIGLLNSSELSVVETGCPDIFCTSLPHHWRANKSLPLMFRIIDASGEIKDGTKVVIFAGNEDNGCAEVRNNVSYMMDGSAVFNDMRFVGRSGRGKHFVLTIAIMSDPMLVATYEQAIKVTVDGPREPRCKSKQSSCSHQPFHNQFRSDASKCPDDEVSCFAFPRNSGDETTVQPITASDDNSPFSNCKTDSACFDFKQLPLYHTLSFRFPCYEVYHTSVASAAAAAVVCRRDILDQSPGPGNIEKPESSSICDESMKSFRTNKSLNNNETGRKKFSLWRPY